MNVSSSGSGYSMYDLIDQYMRIEARPRDILIQKKKSLSDRKSIYSDLDSKLSELKNKLDYLLDDITNHFGAKASKSSDSDKITASTSNGALNGSHSITVERLASSDTRVSNQFNSYDSSFGAFTTDETFMIEVAHPTEEDPDNRVQIEVTIAAAEFSGTDEEVLKAVVDAINGAMREAVNEEIINNDDVIHASIVHEESGTSRLVLGSEKSGYSNRMDFGSSGLLDFLNVNANVQSDGISGGFITDIGTSASTSELNAKFLIDGLTFYRDSNSVNDALDGITFKLLDTFAQSETITITTDVDSVKEDVNSFIEAYNDVVAFLRDNARMNPTTRKHGPLMHDYSYSNMLSELRTMAMEDITSTTSPDFTLLYDIGIEADQKGKLSIKDSEKFNDALETNSNYVAELFRSEDGLAVQLKDYIEGFTSTGGIIDGSKKQLDSEIQGVKERIDYMNELLDQKEKRYFEEFSKLQETMQILQSQQSFFSNFITAGLTNNLY